MAAKIEIFYFSMGYPCTILWAQKLIRDHSISYSFPNIYTFLFSAKIQDGCQKWQKMKFLPFALDTLVLPCGPKILSKSLYL